MAARSRTQTPKSTLVLLALAVALVARVTAPTLAAAEARRRSSVGAAGSVSVLDPGTVTRLSDPGVELTAPVDGRLRGDGVALIVTGAALTDRAGLGDEAVSAGSGRHLIVFAFRQVAQPDTLSPPPSSLALVVAGDRRSIDLADLAGNGPWNFAASIPAGTRDVDLVLAAGGFSQRFSLMTLTRPGPDPVVLYRDVDNPSVVDQDNSAVGLGVTTGPPDSTSYRLMIGAATTTISWFAPDASIRTPASPDQAFLTVALAVTPDPAQVASRYLQFADFVPAEKLHLVLADGTRLAATHVEADNTRMTGIDTLFSGVYYFTVPADISAADLSGDAYSAPGYAGGFFADHATVSLAAFTIPLALSKAPTPAPATSPVTTLQLTHTGAARAGAAAPSGADPTHGSGAAAPWIVLVLVTLVAASIWATTRGRRHLTPRLAAMTAGRPNPPAQPPTMPVPVAPHGTSPPSPPPMQDRPLPHSAPLAPRSVPADPLASRPEPTASPHLAPPVPPADQPQRPTPPVPPRPLPAPVLTPIPARSSGSPAEKLYFEVLGSFRIVGWPDDRPRSVPIIDLATYLALHPERPFTAEDLRDPLSIGKPRALEADTIRTYAGTLRRIVGSDHLPDAGRRGYTLSGAGTDWHKFLVLAGGAPDGGEAAEEATSLAQALGLVRGLPFSDLPGNGFAWVATELLVSRAEVAVTAAARRLVELALTAGDWPLAAWAADRGLMVSPTADELNAGTLRAADLSRHSDRTAQAWRDVARRYAAADEPVPVELRHLYHEIRSRSVTAPRSVDA